MSEQAVAICYVNPGTYKQTSLWHVQPTHQGNLTSQLIRTAHYSAPPRHRLTFDKAGLMLCSQGERPLLRPLQGPDCPTVMIFQEQV